MFIQNINLFKLECLKNKTSNFNLLYLKKNNYKVIN